MNRLMRAGIALVASATLLTLAAGTALAGGWAEAAIVGGGDPPVAGQVQLSATNAESGEEIVVPATSVGNGRWTATITFPTEGDWQIRATHSDLETSGPIGLTVAPVDTLAWLPPVLAVTAFASVAAVAIGAVAMLRRRGTANAPGEVVRAGG